MTMHIVANVSLEPGPKIANFGPGSRLRQCVMQETERDTSSRVKKLGSHACGVQFGGFTKWNCIKPQPFTGKQFGSSTQTKRSASAQARHSII